MSLLGGVITMSGVMSKVTSSSDGTTPKGKGKAKYGTINIAGQEFAIGPEGVEGGGQAAPIPGLPDEPKAALAQLGLTITVPEPVFEVDGKEVKSVVEGLIVEIDTKTLSDGLRQLPLQDILDQLPEEMKDLKKALQAGINLSPRIVIHLGRATSKVETADPIAIPDVVPDNDPDGRGGDHRRRRHLGGGTGGTAGGTDRRRHVADHHADRGRRPPPPTRPCLRRSWPPACPRSSRSPACSSSAASAPPSRPAATYAVSACAALGGGGACSHGLDSGLPDLRKVNA